MEFINLLQGALTFVVPLTFFGGVFYGLFQGVRALQRISSDLAEMTEILRGNGGGLSGGRSVGE
jgi:hypothetical protein